MRPLVETLDKRLKKRLAPSARLNGAVHNLIEDGRGSSVGEDTSVTLDPGEMCSPEGARTEYPSVTRDL
jgi:hypothetical protein